MTKHKTEDYKISAVKYYLNNDKGDGYKKTCKIFDCKKSTLRDWIKIYNSSKNLTRRNRKPISYKITKPQVKTVLELLKKNEQLTMNELAFEEVAFTVMVPPLLILIAVALPKPATELFVPPEIVTACAIFIVPVNA